MITGIAEFLIEPKNDFALKTIETYMYQLERFNDWYSENFGDIPLLYFTAEDFKYYIETHLHTYSSSSKYIAFIPIRSFIRWNFGKSHPALSYWYKRQRTKPQRTLTKKQATHLLEYLAASIDTNNAFNRWHNIRNLAMIALMLDTGFRAGEICGMELDYLDIESGVVHVLCKGGAWAPGAFFEQTAAYLKNWLELRDQLAGPSPCVFVSHSGKRLTTNGLRHMFKRMAERVGFVKGFSPHDLRRTFATLSLAFGAPTRVVQAGGRWSDIKMVEHYSRSLDQRALAPWSPVNRLMDVHTPK